MQKKKVSELLREDYTNEYGALLYGPILLSEMKEGYLNDMRIKKFWERYSSSSPLAAPWHKSGFEITEKDIQKIRQLDDLADMTNSVLESEPVDYSRLVELATKAYVICGRYNSNKAFFDTLHVYMKP